MRRTRWIVVSACLFMTGLPSFALADEPAGPGQAARDAKTNDTSTLRTLFSVLARLTLEEYPAQTPEWFASKAAAEINSGKYDEGMASLRKAIELNDGDIGQSYDPTLRKRLSREAIQHGRRQVRRMLKDRPVMLNHTDKKGPLAEWAIRKFAGEDLGVTIDWDPTPPLYGQQAQHFVPTKDVRGKIRIAKVHRSSPAKGHDLTFEELWLSVIYELHNIANAEEFRDVHENAWVGKLSREQYVEANFRLEHKAIQKTRAFYARIYLPWVKQKRLRTVPQLWYTYMWGGADKWLKTYPRDAEYWALWGRYFDELQASREEPRR